MEYPLMTFRGARFWSAASTASRRRAAVLSPSSRGLSSSPMRSLWTCPAALALDSDSMDERSLTYRRKPVEQPEKLPHAAPAPDLRPGVGILAELHQDPEHAPQQPEVAAVQQAEQQRHAVQRPQLGPHPPHRGQQPQQLRTHPGRERRGSAPRVSEAKVVRASRAPSSTLLSVVERSFTRAEFLQCNPIKMTAL
ncbi:hypothetical protein EYF80_040136 [Liparis tanakae]|uniref:Uncharacterized protein n=1 Tax=Liparis tanakae TaxID=230148 RepID=A0A4Z2G7Z2_9TELE|nr:hypothetical protein EYF80_040136 [Liparis tanakae]